MLFCLIFWRSSKHSFLHALCFSTPLPFTHFPIVLCGGKHRRRGCRQWQNGGIVWTLPISECESIRGNTFYIERTHSNEWTEYELCLYLAFLLRQKCVQARCSFCGKILWGKKSGKKMCTRTVQLLWKTNVRKKCTQVRSSFSLSVYSLNGWFTV